MCGPQAKAIPQCAIAHFGSSRAASWNEAMAAPWLKPCRNASPWLKYCCASAEFVVTFREYEPSPSKNGPARLFVSVFFFPGHGPASILPLRHLYF
jgi:hypothetical protein